MNVEQRGFEPQSSDPLKLVSQSLDRAKTGNSYYQEFGTREQFVSTLLQGLHLDSAEKDGLGLMDRFMGKKRLLSATGVSIVKTSLRMHLLVAKSMDRQLNPMQESLGQDLAQVAIRQFEREGEVCPGVEDLILSAPERFLEQSPGIKSRVFQRAIMSQAEEHRGKQRDAIAVASLLLRQVGVNAELPDAQVYRLHEGELYKISSRIDADLDEKRRALKMRGQLTILDSFWIQHAREQVPHPFFPPKQKK